MRLPREIGPIHFVGIGGIGMSGIAEVLCNLGYTVQGSDASESANVSRLRDKGIKITVGHNAQNVVGADVLVVSTAIKRDNPELMAARAQRIPVVRRAEMLAELMRLKTFVAVQDAFRNFVENVPFYGFAVMCIDHPVVQALVGKIEDRRIITYGENPQADARLIDLTAMGGGSKFKVVFRNRKTDAVHEIADILLPMPGRHNASNATAAIAVAHELGLSDDAIRKAIAGFGGVKRRFTKTGEWNGVTIIDDYGHHPVELAAVPKAAR